MKKLFLASVVLVLLGAGCAAPSAPPSANPQPHFQGPDVPLTEAVRENCLNTGGTPKEDFCDCPDGDHDDPAGFCLDAQGKPGGSTKPEGISK